MYTLRHTVKYQLHLEEKPMDIIVDNMALCCLLCQYQGTFGMRRNNGQYCQKVVNKIQFQMAQTIAQSELDKGLSPTTGVAWCHHLFLPTTKYINVDLEFIIFLHYEI